MALGDQHVRDFEMPGFIVRLIKEEQAGHDPDNGIGAMRLLAIEVEGVGSFRLELRNQATGDLIWASEQACSVREGDIDTYTLTRAQRAVFEHLPPGWSITLHPHHPSIAEPTRRRGRSRRLADAPDSPGPDDDETPTPGGGGGGASRRRG